MQQAFGFALPTVTWTPPKVSELPSWADAKRVAIDYETRDERIHELGPGTRRGAYIVGASFAIEDGPAHYLPFRHQDTGSNLDADHVLAYLRDQAACFNGDLVAANAQYEYDMGQAAGIHFKPRRWLDPQVAEPLLDELQMRYGLDAIAKRRGLPGKFENTLKAACAAFGHKDLKGDLWKLDARYVADYAIQDVRLPLALLRMQEKELEAQDLWVTWELESDILPMLAEMRVRGLRINLDKVDKFETQARAVITQCMARFSALCGYQCTPLDVNRPRALEQALRRLGISVPLTNPRIKNPESTAEGQPQIDKNFFIKHAGVEAVDVLHTARQHDDLAQLCVARKEHAVGGPGGDWRIHATFNQLRREKDDGSGDQRGGRFGRTSCTDPNTQQEAVRFFKMWRSVYEPDDGCDPANGGGLADGDFSQQEPRGWVHYAVMLDLPGAREFAERYRTDPSTDFHSMSAALTGLERGDAKNCGLGIGYGMGGGKLCREWLKLPTTWKISEWGNRDTYEAAGEEGQKILDAYHRGVPFLKPLARYCTERAKKMGYLVLKDADNRRLRFPMKLDGSGFDWVWKALNRIVQGRAAHQTKRALRALGRAGCPLQGCVHDEFYWSTPNRRSAIEFAIVMRDADIFSTGVPNKVNLEIGPNWAEGEEVELVMEAA